nr:immunoglobulin heavy chain junction region [Macaca mulatta]
CARHGSYLEDDYGYYYTAGVDAFDFW